VSLKYIGYECEAEPSYKQEKDNMKKLTNDEVYHLTHNKDKSDKIYSVVNYVWNFKGLDRHDLNIVLKLLKQRIEG